MTRPKWREPGPRWHEHGDRHEHASGIMTALVDLPAYSRAVVVGLPYSRGLAKRLIALGLVPGTEVRVLQNWGHCPLIIEAHGARLALGRGQAARVMVDPLPGVDGEAAHEDDEFCPGDV